MSNLVDEDQEECLGSLVLEMEKPQSAQRWVRRRIESIVFDDEGVVAREIELHINLAEWKTRLIAAADGASLIPIPLQTFTSPLDIPHDLVDGAGRRVAICDSVSERQLVQQGVVARLKDLFRDAKAKVPPDDALSRYVALGMRPVPDDERSRWRKLADAFLGADEPTVDTWGHDVPIILSELDTADRALALSVPKRWSQKFLLLAMVRTTDLTNEVVLRFRLIERGLRVPETSTSRSSRHFRRIRHLASGTLSWRVQHRLDNAYRAETLLIRAQGPPGFLIIDPGVFFACRQDLIRHGYTKYGPSGRTSVELSFQPRGNVAVEPAYLALNFYSDVSGFVSHAASASLLVAIVLLGFTLRLENVGFKVAKFEPHFSAAILLLAPVLLSSIVLIREGGRMTAKAFALTRAALFFQLVGLVCAAFPFAFKLGPGGTEPIWYAAASLAWLGCARVLAGALLQIWRVSEPAASVRQFWRDWEDAYTRSLWEREIDKRRDLVKLAKTAMDRANDSAREAERESREAVDKLEIEIAQMRRVELIEALGHAEDLRTAANTEWSNAQERARSYAEALASRDEVLEAFEDRIRNFAYVDLLEGIASNVSVKGD